MMNSEYSLNEFIYQLNKWKRQIFYGTMAILLVSITGALILPNYYKAETIFYPASQDMADPVPLGYYEKSIRIYGDDKDLDRLFSISQSQDVLFYLIDSFDMYKKYKIKREDHKAKFKVKTAFLKNYKTVKTKHGAIMLSFEDKDPEIAAAVSDSARNKINDIAQFIIKETQIQLAEKYQSNIDYKEKVSDSLGADLSGKRQSFKIYDSRTQGEIYTTILAEAAADLEESKAKAEFYKNNIPVKRDSLIRYQARVKGFTKRLEQITNEMQSFESGISIIKQLESEQIHLHEQISLDKDRLKQLQATIQNPFTALHIIERAEVPVQHSRPNRMIIVVISVMAGFVLCCLAVFMIENLKGILPDK